MKAVAAPEGGDGDAKPGGPTTPSGWLFAASTAGVRSTSRAGAISKTCASPRFATSIARDRRTAGNDRHREGAARRSFKTSAGCSTTRTIDAVSIATPNHWHCAGDDLGLPGRQGRLRREAGQPQRQRRPPHGRGGAKYERIVQTGTQCRSHKGIQDAIAFLRSGKLGQIYMAKGLCYKPRGSIGHKPDRPVLPDVDYNLWLGPAAERPFNANRFHYNWHWIWDYGNGDLGNQGIHQMDLARWGLGKNEFPKAVQASGGRFGYKDDGQTPNTLHRRLRVRRLRAPVRGPRAADQRRGQGQDRRHLLWHRGHPGDHQLHELADLSSGPSSSQGPGGTGGGDHFANFIKAVKARDQVLTADIEEGHLSAPTATWAISPTGWAASCASTRRPSRSQRLRGRCHAHPRISARRSWCRPRCKQGLSWCAVFREECRHERSALSIAGSMAAVGAVAFNLAVIRSFDENNPDSLPHLFFVCGVMPMASLLLLVALISAPKLWRGRLLHSSSALKPRVGRAVFAYIACGHPLRPMVLMAATEWIGGATRDPFSCVTFRTAAPGLGWRLELGFGAVIFSLPQLVVALFGGSLNSKLGMTVRFERDGSGERITQPGQAASVPSAAVCSTSS